MFAAKADDDETIRQMCQQAEANTEIKDTSYGMTAFLLACENGCADAVRALAECGCNQQAKDADGSDGRKLAENEDPPHEDVLAVLVRTPFASVLSPCSGVVLTGVDVFAGRAG